MNVNVCCIDFSLVSTYKGTSHKMLSETTKTHTYIHTKRENQAEGCLIIINYVYIETHKLHFDKRGKGEELIMNK
jgi:hypothetical protein